MPVWTWSYNPGRGCRERRRDETHQRGVDPGSADPLCTAAPLSPLDSGRSCLCNDVGASPTWPDSTWKRAPNASSKPRAYWETGKLPNGSFLCRPWSHRIGRCAVGRLLGLSWPPLAILQHQQEMPMAGHISRPRDCRERRDCVDERPAGSGPFCNRHLPHFFPSHEQTMDSR